MEKLEEIHLHLFDHNHRIETVEEKVTRLQQENVELRKEVELLKAA